MKTLSLFIVIAVSCMVITTATVVVSIIARSHYSNAHFIAQINFPKIGHEVAGAFGAIKNFTKVEKLEAQTADSLAPHTPKTPQVATQYSSIAKIDFTSILDIYSVAIPAISGKGAPGPY